MVTGELKSQVDKIWETFWTGGISNPLTVIEQFTFLLFLRRLDENQLRDEKQANFSGTALKNPLYSEAQSKFRWSKFVHVEPETMFVLFTQAQADVDNLTVFEHMKQLGDKGGIFAKHMKGATFMIPTNFISK